MAALPIGIASKYRWLLHVADSWQSTSRRRLRAWITPYEVCAVTVQQCNNAQRQGRSVRPLTTHLRCDCVRNLSKTVLVLAKPIQNVLNGRDLPLRLTVSGRRRRRRRRCLVYGFLARYRYLRLCLAFFELRSTQTQLHRTSRIVLMLLPTLTLVIKSRARGYGSYLVYTAMVRKVL